MAIQPSLLCSGKCPCELTLRCACRRGQAQLRPPNNVPKPIETKTARITQHAVRRPQSSAQAIGTAQTLIRVRLPPPTHNTPLAEFASMKAGMGISNVSLLGRALGEPKLSTSSPSSSASSPGALDAPEGGLMSETGDLTTRGTPRKHKCSMNKTGGPRLTPPSCAAAGVTQSRSSRRVAPLASITRDTNTIAENLCGLTQYPSNR